MSENKSRSIALSWAPSDGHLRIFPPKARNTDGHELANGSSGMRPYRLDISTMDDYPLRVMASQHPKRDYLASAGALHPRPADVQAEPFRSHRFFDPLDKVQVKYEMLRAHAVDGQSVVTTAAAYGCSRETFYQALRAFEAHGILALRDEKRGRRGPVKLTPELIAWVRALAREEPTLSGRAIAQRLAEEHGLAVHRRTIERLLAQPRKKNR